MTIYSDDEENVTQALHPVSNRENIHSIHLKNSMLYKRKGNQY